MVRGIWGSRVCVAVILPREWSKPAGHNKIVWKSLQFLIFHHPKLRSVSRILSCAAHRPLNCSNEFREHFSFGMITPTKLTFAKYHMMFLLSNNQRLQLWHDQSNKRLWCAPTLCVAPVTFAWRSLIGDRHMRAAQSIWSRQEQPQKDDLAAG